MDKLLFLTRTFHAVVQELRVTFRCVCFSQILGQKRKSAIGTSPRVNFRESRDVISVSSLSGLSRRLHYYSDLVLRSNSLGACVASGSEVSASFRKNFLLRRLQLFFRFFFVQVGYGILCSLFRITSNPRKISDASQKFGCQGILLTHVPCLWEVFSCHNAGET